MACGHPSYGRLFDVPPVKRLHARAEPCLFPAHRQVPSDRGAPLCGQRLLRVSVQKQATIYLAVLVTAVLVRNIGGGIIQGQANDAQTGAQAAQLLQTNEKQFAIGLLNHVAVSLGECGYCFRLSIKAMTADLPLAAHT